jgi:hypothetical protein
MNAESAILDEGVKRTVRYAVRRVPSNLLEDATQEAFLAVIEASGRFDEGAGVKIRSFVQYRVCGRVQDFLRKEDPLTRAQRKRVRAGIDTPVNMVGLDVAERMSGSTSLGGGYRCSRVVEGVESHPAPRDRQTALGGYGPHGCGWRDPKVSWTSMANSATSVAENT